MKFRHRQRVPVQKRRIGNSADGPVVNAGARSNPGARPNPLRMDPTRTTTLRRQLASELKRRFARLKLVVAKLVLEEDAFGLKAPTQSQLYFNELQQEYANGGEEEEDAPEPGSNNTDTLVDSNATDGAVDGTISDNNCGTGGGGFKPGNTCATGGRASGGGGGGGGKGGGGAAGPEIVSDIDDIVALMADDFDRDFGFTEERTREGFVKNWTEKLAGLKASPEEVSKLTEAVQQAHAQTEGLPSNVPVIIRRSGGAATGDVEFGGASYNKASGSILLTPELLKDAGPTKALGAGRLIQVPNAYENKATGAYVHELGHHYHEKVSPGSVSRAADLLGSAAGKESVKQHISRYGATDKQEAVAEAYAMRHHKDYTSLPAETKRVVEGLLGPTHNQYVYNNCGTGGGGFKPGNTCGAGGSGGGGGGGGKVGGGGKAGGKTKRAGGGGAAAAEEEVDPKKKHVGLLAKLKAAGAAIGHLEHSVKEYITSKVELNVAKMPLAVQSVLRASYHVAKAGTQVAFASWTAGQALAERTAIKRGYTPEQAKTLRGVLTGVDIGAMKPIQIGLGAAGMKALALPASLIPPATTAYLAYSTARNPVATYRAAKELIGEGIGRLAQRLSKKQQTADPTGKPATRFAKLGVEQLNTEYVFNQDDTLEEELIWLVANDAEANTQLIADELERHNHSDWYVALFHAAVEATRSVRDALALAAIMFEDVPEDPTNYDEPTDADVEAVFGSTLDELEALKEHKDDVAGNTTLILFQASKDLTLIDNQRWRFHAEADKVREFRRWLKVQVNENISGVADEALWHKYIMNVYRKGMGRAHDNVAKATRGAARRSKDDLLRGTTFRPEVVDKVRLLATRAFTDLEGVTEAMSVAMARTLAEGLVRKDSPATIARNLLNNIEGIGVNRALAVAKTEIVRAHAEGQLDAMEDLGVDEVSTMVEWNTSGNPCPLCADMSGVVLTIDEAHGLIPRHPHCACAWEVAAVSESEEQITQKREIERALKRSASGTGIGDTWPGKYRSVRSRRDLFNNEDNELPPLPEPLVEYLGPLTDNLAIYVDNNCGTGGGGFKPGNTCAAGGGGGGGGGGSGGKGGSKKGAGKAGGGAATKEEEDDKEELVPPGPVLGSEFDRSATEAEKVETKELVKERSKIRARVKKGEATQDDLRREEAVQKRILEIRQEVRKRDIAAGHQSSTSSSVTKEGKKGGKKEETKKDDKDEGKKEETKTERIRLDTGDAGVKLMEQQRQQRKEREEKDLMDRALKEARRINEEHAIKQKVASDVQRMLGEDHARQQAQFGQGAAVTVGQSLTKDQLKVQPGKVLYDQQERSRLEKVVDSYQTTSQSPVQAGGMAKPEAMRTVTVDGVKFSWAEAHKDTAAIAIIKTANAVQNGQMPEPLWRATNEVVFSTQSNKDDSFWAKEYNTPGFRSAATGGNGTTTVYNVGISLGTFAHEGGHNLATRLWGNTHPPATSRYGQAQAVEKPVSSYAKNSKAEDWAEACQRYVTDKGALQREFPLKFAAVEHHMKEAEGLLK